CTLFLIWSTHTELYTLSLHDVLPFSGIWPYGSGTVSTPNGKRLLFLPQRPYLRIATLREVLSYPDRQVRPLRQEQHALAVRRRRSEEHTSELQSRGHLVCRLLLEKKK